jgi:hypothetical protein
MKFEINVRLFATGYDCLLDGVAHANLHQTRLLGEPLLGHFYRSVDVHHAIWQRLYPTDNRG